ncbi:uncharacterized protein LOC122803422 [Protopterus annectens]|uniref:uncharacterized protein LOC122803422 n=1 Tax=Protopterus annectens TaxID=7888 RepID=UPI001CF9ECFF|nr:uncharacterized protein LOC122803422 [Protopterus annectens]
MNDSEQLSVTLKGPDWKKTGLFQIKQSDSLTRLKSELENSGCTGLLARDMTLSYKGRPPLCDMRSIADFVWSPCYSRFEPCVSLFRRCRGHSLENGEFVVYVTGFVIDTFFPVFVTGSPTVSSLKKYMQQLRRAENMVLYQMEEGIILEDGTKSLLEYGIKPDSALSLLPVPDDGGKPFLITVRHYEGHQMVVNVLGSETVGHLNLRLWLKGFIASAPDKQWVKYGERRLESWELLQDCNVGPDSVLDLVQKRLQGSPNLPLTAYLRGLEILVDVDSVKSVPSDNRTGGRQRDYRILSSIGACDICHLRQDLSKWQLVDPQVISYGGTSFSITFPGKGHYQCSVTGLRWKTKTATTLHYRYRSWHYCAPDLAARGWSPASPLFDFTSTNGAIASVQIPHFLCMKGLQSVNGVRALYMLDDNYSLQEPSHIFPGYASLSKPRWSVTGLVHAMKNMHPVHGVVLIYRTLSIDRTLHVYLIANDHSVEQAVHSFESRSVKISKFWTTRPLYVDEMYSLTSSTSAVLRPSNIEFRYMSFDQEQSFCMVHTKDRGSDIDLSFTTQDSDCIWKCLLKAGDINVSHMVDTAIRVVDLADVPPDPKLPGDPFNYM